MTTTQPPPSALISATPAQIWRVRPKSRISGSPSRLSADKSAFWTAVHSSTDNELLCSGADVSSKANLRAYQPQDRESLMAVLQPVLAKLYPGGPQWLKRRLSEIEPGGPRCTLALSGRSIVGVAIETPKSGAALKLSTLYVSRVWRGRGLGTTFANFLADRWREEGRMRVHLTAPDSAPLAVYRCLSAIGFTEGQYLEERYGKGRNEVLMTWSAEQSLSPSRYDFLPEELAEGGKISLATRRPPVINNRIVFEL
jgi:GNAT superfamily N-acetyltransferase